MKAICNRIVTEQFRTQVYCRLSNGIGFVTKLHMAKPESPCLELYETI
jgi:hypothetical protein